MTYKYILEPPLRDWPDNAGTDSLTEYPANMQVDVLLGHRDCAGWPVRDAAAAEEDE